MQQSHPRSGGDITVPWINEMLVTKGGFSGAVIAFSLEPVGETAGFLGDIVRITLSWDVAGSQPNSIIAKFPTIREANRETGKNLLAYERELKFYQHFSEGCPVNPPTFYGGVDVTGEQDFLILIEDLKAARFASQLEALSTQDARQAVLGLARMHAHYWQSPALAEAHQFKDWAPIYGPSIASGWPLFEQDFGDLIPDEMYPMFEPGNRMAGRVFEYFSRARPQTLVHGDARIENICFDGSNLPRMYDWQLASSGPGAYDLMYFFANSIEADQLAVVGQELVSLYFDGLVEGGVTDYSREDLNRDLQIASCLLFGFSSMVGNFLANGGEAERAIVAATTPRYWGTCQFFEVGDVIEGLAELLV